MSLRPRPGGASWLIVLVLPLVFYLGSTHAASGLLLISAAEGEGDVWFALRIDGTGFLDLDLGALTPRRGPGAVLAWFANTTDVMSVNLNHDHSSWIEVGAQLEDPHVEVVRTEEPFYFVEGVTGGAIWELEEPGYIFLFGMIAGGSDGWFFDLYTREGETAVVTARVIGANPPALYTHKDFKAPAGVHAAATDLAAHAVIEAELAVEFDGEPLGTFRKAGTYFGTPDGTDALEMRDPTGAMSTCSCEFLTPFPGRGTPGGAYSFQYSGIAAGGPQGGEAPVLLVADVGPDELAPLRYGEP